MRGVVIRCAWCGKPKRVGCGQYNRALQHNAPLYCGKPCASLGRRKHKTKAQRVAEKREYDRQYRATNLAMLKAKKAEYFKRTYDPTKAAIVRKARMPKHVEYCRRPEYKRWKAQYDRQFRAKKFGAFAEAFMLTIELNRAIKERATNAEIKWENRTSNKAQFRRRDAGQEKSRGRPRIRHRRSDHQSANG